MQMIKFHLKFYIVTVLFVFAYMFVFDFFWHGLLLKDLYQQTSSVWRDAAEMQSLIPWAIAKQALLACGLAFLFTQNYEHKGLAEGLRFGLIIGVIMTAVNFGMYPYLPIPLVLAGLWALGGFLFGIGLGFVCAIFYKPNSEPGQMIEKV